MNTTFLSYLIIFILVVDFIIDQWVSYLNSRHFDKEIPEELKDIYDEVEYKKSQAYKKTNYRFGVITASFSILLTLLFLLFDGFEYVDTLVRNYVEHPILVALLFFGLIMLGSDIISTPFSWYKTFVIEEKFGFNKTTMRTFILDKIKGWILTIIIGGGILAAIIWFYSWSGKNFWLYAWGIIAIFSLLANLFYSRFIVPLFNKQKPLEAGELKTKIEAYASAVGFKLSNIFIIDGSKRSTKANAYFSGFGSEKRISLYDTLVNDLEDEEIVAVLAHEVGHYKKNHIIFNLIVSLLLTGLTLFILSLFINNPELSRSIGVETPSFHVALIAFGILYSPISEITGLFMNYFSRKFEYQADAYAKNTYAATPLITSLKKLSKSSLSNLTPHPFYIFMHYSHPTLYQRINKLKV